MKKLPYKSLVALLFFFVGTCFSGPAFPQVAKPDSDGFSAFFAKFQEAVAKNDGEAITAMADFPRFRWEPLTDQDLKTKEEFLKLYPKMFTPEVKKKLATAKPYKTAGGDYLIDWTASHLQYTLAFDHQKDGGFKFSGLLRGPE